ncbi:hypothetical protein L227DRAFT_337291 [Lentinus tigrinus ALCF2SS1-6]|uniref:Uncharacterized protein n=1 Tax=Lentinus tigrinus ALCF2SS1-6 TaxID=1328759 RepID=A0A5C2RWS4_9APHY|nr:hypothetical protein L227DRAFT_337291 [Lentinus tigrinus ALCF2SS1-6]
MCTLCTISVGDTHIDGDGWRASSPVLIQLFASVYAYPLGFLLLLVSVVRITYMASKVSSTFVCLWSHGYF